MLVRLRAVPPEYWLLIVVFVASRLGLRAIGFHYSLELDWMFLDDPAKLEHQLARSLLDFHVYPPGMNLLTGLLLKLSPTHLADLTALVFAAAGLALAGSLLYLLRALGLPRE